MTSTLVSQFEGLVTGTWSIDPSHSEVGFTVRHLMSKVRGQFRTFDGTLTIARTPSSPPSPPPSTSARSTPATTTATTTCGPTTSSPSRPRRR